MAKRTPAQELAAEVVRLELQVPRGPDDAGSMDVPEEAWERMVALAMAVLGPRGVVELSRKGARRAR